MLFALKSIRLPRPVTAVWDWQLDAACRKVDANLFFHPDNERGEKRLNRTRAAKRVCQGCPVRAWCLCHAIDAGEQFGIWGGTTEEERRRNRLSAGIECAVTEAS